MQRTNWNIVQIGQIVTFRYKGKKTNAVNRKRECLILNPNHRYRRKDGKKVRLIHAIQLSSIPKISGVTLSRAKINKLFESVYDIQSASPKAGYRTIGRVIDTIGKPIYRTFAWYILNKNGVFITKDLKLTTANKQKLLELSRNAGIKIDESDF